jgi:hypothetical protein
MSKVTDSPNYQRLARSLQASVLVSGETRNEPGLALKCHEFANFLMTLTCVAVCHAGTSVVFREDADQLVTIADIQSLLVSLLIWFTRVPYTVMEGKHHVCAQVVHKPREMRSNGIFISEHFIVSFFVGKVVFDRDNMKLHPDDRRKLEEKPRYYYLEGQYCKHIGDRKQVLEKVFEDIQNDLVRMDSLYNNPNKEGLKIVRIAEEVRYETWFKFAYFNVHFMSQAIAVAALPGKQKWCCHLTAFDPTAEHVKDKRTRTFVQKLFTSFFKSHQQSEITSLEPIDKKSIPVEGDTAKIMNPAIPDETSTKMYNINCCLERLLSKKNVGPSALGMEVSVSPHGPQDKYIVDSMDEATGTFTLNPIDSARTMLRGVRINGETDYVKFSFEDFVPNVEPSTAYIRLLPYGSWLNLEHNDPTNPDKPPFNATILPNCAGDLFIHPITIGMIVWDVGMMQLSNNMFFIDEFLEELPETKPENGVWHVLWDKTFLNRGVVVDLQNVVLDLRQPPYPHYRFLLENEREVEGFTEFEQRLLKMRSEIIVLNLKDKDGKPITRQTSDSYYSRWPTLKFCEQYVAHQAAFYLQNPFGVEETQRADFFGKKMRSIRELANMTSDEAYDKKN